MPSKYRFNILAFALALSISTFTLGCDSSGTSRTKDASFDTVSSSSDTLSSASDTMNTASQGGVSGTAGAGGSTNAGGMGHGGTAGSSPDGGTAGSGGMDAMNDASADVFGEFITTANPADSPCPSDGRQFCFHDTGAGTLDLHGTCLGLLCCYGCIKDGVCHRGNEQAMCGGHGLACESCGVTPGSDPTCKPGVLPQVLQWVCQK